MRILIIDKATDGAALASKLFAREAKSGGLDSLQRLNPHIDFNHIGAGVVLVVPDRPGVKHAATTSVEGENFEAFGKQINEEVARTVARVQASYLKSSREQRETAAFIEQRLAPELARNDPDLSAQLEAVLAEIKQSRARAKEALALLEQLQDGSKVALDALRAVLV